MYREGDGMDEQLRAGRAGTLLYDGSCGFCTDIVLRWRGYLLRNGFGLSTLQSAAAEGLIPNGPGLLNDVLLRSPNGTLFVGADAYLAILDAIWYARPAAWLLRLPPLHALLTKAYRRVADNRYVLGGTCSLAAGDTLTADPPAKNAETG